MFPLHHGSSQYVPMIFPWYLLKSCLISLISSPGNSLLVMVYPTPGFIIHSCPIGFLFMFPLYSLCDHPISRYYPSYHGNSHRVPIICSQYSHDIPSIIHQVVVIVVIFSNYLQIVIYPAAGYIIILFYFHDIPILFPLCSYHSYGYYHHLI